jgi:YidC/Oxa1 family membrane protein insertase
MNDQKRFILAIVLIMIILGAYSLLGPQQKKNQPVEKETNIAVPAEQAQQNAILPKSTINPPQKEEPSIEISAAFMRLELSTDRASIYKLWEKAYGNGDFLKEPLLAAASGNKNTLELALDAGVSSESEYYLDKKDGNELIFKNGNKELEITKKYSLSNSNYNIELQILFKNRTNADKILNYDLTAAGDIQLTSILDKRFLNVGSYDGKNVVWINPKEAIKAAKDGNVYSYAKNPNWAVLRNTHSSVIIRPLQEIGYVYLSWDKGAAKEQDNWSLGLKSLPVVVPAGAEVSHEYVLYAGPTMEEYLSPIDLSEAVNYGKLDIICKALIKVLGFFYGLTNSYGISIVFLVILVNIFTYPLTFKNVKSMRNMQAVQPHLAKLRETHKDDQKKMQSEMMRLYRENNVNPLGGCLPMFLQMPIFISLYITLARSPMLKGSNFLWIKDLSMPDTLFKLPTSLPILGDNFNLLPILMMIAMVVQQKISMNSRSAGERTPQEEQQQKMMIMMPIVFGFIFYSLPSGLVLYWTVNTALMALSHFVIQKHLEKNTATGV